MSDNNDAEEFLKQASKFEEQQDKLVSFRELILPTSEEDVALSKESDNGQPVQYAYYKDGFIPTTSTVSKLPIGCYDLSVDNKVGVYASKTLPPTGLLLDLPEMRSNDIIKLVEKFWDSEKDYKDGNEYVVGGARYKLGVLLFGPPGSGKSSIIKLLSKSLVDRGGTVFFADCHPSLVNSFLTSFAKVENNRKCIVILEDIDDLIRGYGETGYLQMLDSAKTIDNVLFIATTNYPDRLDPRIFNRPGRLSHIIKVGLPGTEARRAYLKAVLKKHDEVETIVGKTEGFTIDHLSSLVDSRYREKKELLPEIERLRTLFRVPRIEEGDGAISLGKKADNI